MLSSRNFFIFLTYFLIVPILAVTTVYGESDRDAGRYRSRKVFDNWNTSACEATGTAVFVLDRSIRAERIEVWYRWHNREGSVGYTLSKDGLILRSGILQRSDCDPYQEKWCVAVDGFDLLLRPGTYIIRTERPRICQNPGSDGNGFVKVFGAPH
jgi:hypothetical protein